MVLVPLLYDNSNFVESAKVRTEIVSEFCKLMTVPTLLLIWIVMLGSVNNKRHTEAAEMRFLSAAVGYIRIDLIKFQTYR
jgi:hypothetical protein